MAVLGILPFAQRPKRSAFLARVALWFTLLAIGGAWVAPSAKADPRSSRIPVVAQSLRIAVVTFGPGDHPFAKFGHDAIWVELPDGRGAIYNFGTFGGETSSLITKFLQGRFNYWLSLSPPAATLQAYQSYDRTIEVQDLALTPEEKLDLWRRLEINARPENREYLYDYFKDNCSTRVRDAIDAVLKGQLKKALIAKPARLNFREHALRLSADLPWLYVGLHFGLAQEADKPRNRWEEGFIPEGVQDSLAGYKIERNGVSVPIVAKLETVYRATRTPAPSVPPTTWHWFLLAGLGVAGLLFALGAFARSSTLLRVLYGSLVSLFSLVFGFLGLVLVFFWGFTNHQIAYRNENIALCPPWLLIASVAGIGVAFGSVRFTRQARWIFRATLALSLFALTLKLTPWFFQENKEFVLFFIPVWASLAMSMHRLLEALGAKRSE